MIEPVQYFYALSIAILIVVFLFGFYKLFLTEKEVKAVSSFMQY